MQYSTIFIDLDETVYATATGVWDAISVRMELYMHERLLLPLEEIPALRSDLYHTYGTTLRGLQQRFQVNEREFIDYVHDVPLDQLLQPDPHLRQVLLQYPARKIIFTNADRSHAGRVIDRLQLGDCFAGMVDIYDMAPYCKPMPEAYQIALAAAGEKDARKCIFIDDSPRNLNAALELGFFTIQVGSPKAGFSHPRGSSAHAIINRLHDLPSVLDWTMMG
jgi:putative hydrolase of the HAD superfamily